MVKNIQGKTPGSEHAVKNAVERVSAAGPKDIAVTTYANSGRRYSADGPKRVRMQKPRKILAWRLEIPPRSLPEPLKIEPRATHESPDATKSRGGELTLTHQTPRGRWISVSRSKEIVIQTQMLLLELLLELLVLLLLLLLPSLRPL